MPHAREGMSSTREDAGSDRALATASFWDGLPPATSRALAGGQVALRPPIEGRVLGPRRVSSADGLVAGGPEARAGLLPIRMSHSGRIRGGATSRSRSSRGGAGARRSPLSPCMQMVDRTEVTVAAYSRCVAVGGMRATPRLHGDARCAVRPSRPPGEPTSAWDSSRHVLPRGLAVDCRPRRSGSSRRAAPSSGPIPVGRRL